LIRRNTEFGWATKPAMARSGRTVYDFVIVGDGSAGVPANKAVLLASANNLP
jgi:hypothetical protein